MMRGVVRKGITEMIYTIIRYRGHYNNNKLRGAAYIGSEKSLRPRLQNRISSVRDVWTFFFYGKSFENGPVVFSIHVTDDGGIRR